MASLAYLSSCLDNALSARQTEFDSRMAFMKVVLPELLQYTAAEIVSSKLQKAKCKMLLKAPFKIAL